MPKSKEFQKLSALLTESKRILVSTHVLPDGDGIGAEYALFHYLKRAKKACRIYNPDPLPKRYQFLDPKKNILLGPGEVELWDTCDLWLILDTNDPKRVGPLWNELNMRAKKIVFLDHHPGVQGKEAVQYPPHAMVVSDTQSSSIGELLWELFEDLNLVKMNKDIAHGIYVSVMTDTNSFRYARTTPKSHEIAAEVIRLGVDPEEVYQNIYSSKEVPHLQLLGEMLRNVKVSEGSRVAWLEMDLKLRKEFRASSDDTQSFMNLLLLLKDSEVVCLFREEDDHKIRVSMRSKGKVIINRIAMDLGGGGHDFAAGTLLETELSKAVETVTSRLIDAVDYFERFGKQKS